MKISCVCTFKRENSFSNIGLKCSMSDVSNIIFEIGARLCSYHSLLTSFPHQALVITQHPHSIPHQTPLYTTASSPRFQTMHCSYCNTAYSSTFHRIHAHTTASSPPFHTIHCSHHSLLSSFPHNAVPITLPPLLLSTQYTAHTTASSPPFHTMQCP
jgi:hypothetical protein